MDTLAETYITRFSNNSCSPSEIKRMASSLTWNGISWNRSASLEGLPCLTTQHASREVDDGTSPTAHIPYEITQTACPLQPGCKPCASHGLKDFTCTFPSSPWVAGPYLSASVASLSDTQPDCNYVEQTQARPWCMGIPPSECTVLTKIPRAGISSCLSPVPHWLALQVMCSQGSTSTASFGASEQVLHYLGPREVRGKDPYYSISDRYLPPDDKIPQISPPAGSTVGGSSERYAKRYR
jgi:hypothetical protein